MGFRYIGTKSSVLPILLSKISELTEVQSHITDLMCGTATVSAALRGIGYKVTAVDVMTYSYHHASVALMFTSMPGFLGIEDFYKAHDLNQKSLFGLSSYQATLVALNSLPPEEGYFYREFSKAGAPKNGVPPRNYFSPDNAMKIDAMRRVIKELKIEGRISDLEHSLLLHDLIMAVNDVANIAGTYGHYLSSLRGRAKDEIELKPSKLLIKDDQGCNFVYQGYAEDVAREIECDLCYIDPPYMKRQYAANYHVLETVAREDTPEAVGVSGLRPWRDQYSDFCTKTGIHDAFRKIFKEMKTDKFLVSYSEDGLLDIEELIEFMAEFGRVELNSFKNTRFKSNNSKLEKSLTEYLIYLQRS